MLAGLLCVSLLSLANPNSTQPQVRVIGGWQIEVSSGIVKTGKNRIKITKPQHLAVANPDIVTIINERYDSVPSYDQNAAPWTRGYQLRGLTTIETTAADCLVPESVVIKSVEGDIIYKSGVDYGLEPRWATFGRLPDGAIPVNGSVLVDYTYGRSHLDSIVVDKHGIVSLIQGTPHTATPMPPNIGADSVVIANVWVPSRLTALTDDNLYPILEPKYPEPKNTGIPSAARLLPKTWAKLCSGKSVQIIAWGDSVTAGGQASDAAHQYQNQFAALLQKRFPKASIQLTTVAWGGRASESFLNEPKGSAYNFEEKIVQPRPDLIIMEFVNDAYLTPEQIETRYSALKKRFDEIGAEWIILTPHFVRPDWMGQTTVRVEKDPRIYTSAVREFCTKHGVALADAALRWGHLLKEGIPYTTLLSNSINHPDDRGHEIFAKALMELFGSGK